MFRKKKDRSGVRYGIPKVPKEELRISNEQIYFSKGQMFRKIPDRVGITYDAPKLKLTNRNIGKPYHNEIIGVTDENIETIHPKNITMLIEHDLNLLDPNEYAIEEVKMSDEQHKHKVKWYCVRFIDPVYNEVTFRIKSWSNFTIIVYINGFRIIAKYCDDHGIAYTLSKDKPNAFENIDMTHQKMMKIAAEALSQEKLRALFQRHIQKILPSLANFYNPRYAVGQINQLELAYDEKYPDKATATMVFWKWVNDHRTIFPKGQIYWDDDVLSFDVPQEPGDEPQFKVYAYDNMLRFEFTYNTKHLQERRIRRSDIDEVNREGEKDFIMLAEKTTPIRLRDIVPTRKRVRELSKMIRSEEDIGYLWALQRHCWGVFKNEDIQESSGEILKGKLTRGQVQYREREKFPELIEKVVSDGGKVSRKWRVNSAARWLISYIIKMLDEFTLLYERVIGKVSEHITSLELPQIGSPDKRIVNTKLDCFG